MVFASMLSYARWVPTHTIKTILNRYAISTIRRKLLPWILNTTRLFERIDAFPNWAFSSCGEPQFDFEASSNQDLSGSSATGCRSQKDLNVFFAMIRTKYPNDGRLRIVTALVTNCNIVANSFRR